MCVCVCVFAHSHSRPRLQIELREEPWREAPYFGWAPPSMYVLVSHVCPLAETLEEDRSWEFIDKQVDPQPR